MELETRSLDVERFSTARTIPSLVWIPTAVEPSCETRNGYGKDEHVSTRLSEGTRISTNPLYLDCFNSILHLEQTTFGRECVDTTVVFRLA